MVESDRIAATAGSAGLVLRECEPGSILSLLARRGVAAELSAAIAAEFGVGLPLQPGMVQHDGVSFIWSGPGQWLAQAGGTGHALEARLRTVCRVLASVVDQSDSRVILELGGPRVREVLAKGFPVDLHPAVFGVGHVAVAPVAHIGTQLWQVAEAPVYRVAIPRSYARSWRHWLEASAAEFGGFEVQAKP